LASGGKVDELIKSIGPNKIVKTKRQMDKWVDVWTDTFEFTSRAAAFAVAKKDFMAKGMSEVEANKAAAAYAKNLANFEQVGEWGRAAGAAFMFFRPAATGAVRALDALAPIWQDTEKLIRALPKNIQDNAQAVENFRKRHAELKRNARAMVFGLLGTGATIYLMAWMMSDDDDQGRNRVATDDMSRWTRYLRLPITILGKENFFQIPWGFGLGAFGAMGAQFAALATGNSSVKDFGGNAVTIAMDSYLPLPVSRINALDNPMAFIVDSMLPSVVRPFVEYQMNVDGLGRQIYNNRQSRYGSAYTGGDNIPEIYKGAARLLAEVSDGKVDISPNSMYFFANNYADGVSKVAETMGNLLLFTSGKKDFDPKIDTLFLNSFIGRASNYDAREYASIEKQIKEKESAINMFKKNKPEKLVDYAEKYPMDFAIVEIYNKQTAQLNKIRQAMNLIRGSDMTPKEKKAILDDLRLAQNMYKRALIDTFRDFDIRP